MSASAEPDDQLESALEDYLTRVDAGSVPDPEEYLRRYPACADRLRRFFNDLSFVDARLAEEQDVPQSAVLADYLAGVRLDRTTPGAVPSAGPGLPHVRGFRLLRELGRGSQGVVHQAEQLSTKRTVALKVIREGAFASEAERRRFENEIELASRLTHPNIVRIYDSGSDAGRHYFAMEYIDGEPLDAYIAGRTLTDREALHLFQEICDGVRYAHQRGVIHRDLKPSNVIVDGDGHPHILDFGLAKPIPGASGVVVRGVTEVGDFAGTWHYASPEQIKRDPALVDVRTDVYALGVTLYELVTDAYPYAVESESKDVIARHILESLPIRPSLVRRDIDDDLETIILRALHKDPDRRYQSAAAFGDDIRCYLEGLPIEAKRDSAWYVVHMTLRRHRWRVAAAVTALIAVLVFAVTVSILYSQAVSARAEAEAAQATTEVRAGIVRASQAYVSDKLDELHRMDNLLAEIAGAHPDLRQLDALDRIAHENPLPLFGAVVKDMPEGVFDAMRSGNESERRAALAWLTSREDLLADIDEMCLTTRFVFGVNRARDTDFTAADLPGCLSYAEQLCEALAARALRDFRDGNHEGAVTGLSTARSIALDVGDGRLLHHKTMSVSIRSRIYDVVRVMLGDAYLGGADGRAYVDWVLCDPPLARYRLAMVSERQKRSQLFETLFVAAEPGQEGYLDLDALDARMGGMYSRTGGLTEASRALARSITPAEALDAVDLYIQEVERWDSLPFQALDERTREVGAALRRNRAWVVVRPLVWEFKTAFRRRARVEAERSATLLTARICRYHEEHGHWPRELLDALPQAAHLEHVDPYTGRPFGYALVEGKPLLYSINEDGTDNEGLCGDWGEEGTDVPLFPLPGR